MAHYTINKNPATQQIDDLMNQQIHRLMNQRTSEL